MKKIILLLIAGYYSSSVIAQTTEVKNYTTDKDLSRWVIDINALGGIYDQQMDFAATAPNYLNGINVNTGTPGFKPGGALGGDLQLGYFMGKNKHWGLGTGILYMREWGNITLDNFHAEYQSVDNNGYVFRQVVSSNSINERIKTDNFNIPLLLKYKNRFSKHWGFTADMGALFNLQMKNHYATNASFDYEAIYKFITDDAGISTPVYDYSTIPGNTDFLITKYQYTKNNPGGNVQDYFNTKRAEGYNVGLGINPTQKNGTISYATVSVGLLLQPSFNYFFSDHVALNVGAYFLYQPFKNEGTSTYTMTNKPGEYRTVLGSSSAIKTQSYGVNIGLRFFLGGKKSTPLNITSTNQYDPSMCGSCDGKFTLNGLPSGEKATVYYNVNGANTPNTYSGVVNNDGAITVSDLCAGNYTDIKATIGKKTAGSKSVNLVAPSLTIDNVEHTNPTKGNCDGSISLFGLRSGQHATITYTINGNVKTYNTSVSNNNALLIPGLCEGTVTNITVQSNKCTAQVNNPSSIVLETPKPVVTEQVIEEEDTTSQILFDFNTSTLRPSSYLVLDRAYEELKEDKNTYVYIDGNTDKIGTDEYNQKLSERRAAAVRAYLVKKGISNSRIKSQGNGEREPVATNNTVEGRSKNRRAELVIKIR